MFLLVLIVIAVIAVLVYNFITASPTSQNGTVSDLEPTDSVQNLIVPHGGVPYMMAPTGRTKVVGERHHKKDIRAAIGNRMDEVKPLGQWDQSLELKAEIRRQPNNTYDHNAVAIILEGRLVAYIPSEDTGSWQPLLQRLESEGRYAQATAAIYSSHGDGYTIILKANPSITRTRNVSPGSTVLDADRTVAISGEETIQEQLARYGVGNFVWVTLQPGTIPKGKYKDGPTIFAYMDGQQAGYISAKQSERYYLYIKRRMPCSCLAYIEQGGKKLELQLMLPARS